MQTLTQCKLLLTIEYSSSFVIAYVHWTSVSFVALYLSTPNTANSNSDKPHKYTMFNYMK